MSIIIPTILMAYGQETQDNEVPDQIDPELTESICGLQIKTAQIDFGDVSKNQESTTQSVTLVNTGNVRIGTLLISVTDWFDHSDNSIKIINKNVTTYSTFEDFSAPIEFKEDNQATIANLLHTLVPPIEGQDEGEPVDVFFKLDKSAFDNVDFIGTVNQTVTIEPVCRVNGEILDGAKADSVIFSTNILPEPLCHLELKTLSIDFGDVHRGGQSLPQTVTIVNKGNQVINELTIDVDNVGWKARIDHRPILFHTATMFTMVEDFSDNLRLDTRLRSITLDTPLAIPPIGETEGDTTEIIFKLDIGNEHQNERHVGYSGAITQTIIINSVCNS